LKVFRSGEPVPSGAQAKVDFHSTGRIQETSVKQAAPSVQAVLALLRPALFLIAAAVLVAAPTVTADDLTDPECRLVLAGPDNLWYVCHNLSDTRCPVYTIHVGKEGYTTKNCLP
jgi:hypothetical protein